jgi:hypothetical protein
MPTLSVFYGITIQMYWQDHGPPHFHAQYGDFEAIVGIRDQRMTRGYLPRRALVLVIEWAMEHRDELQEDWDLCRVMKTPKPIAPLK